jgi:hypothetical protein
MYIYIYIEARSQWVIFLFAVRMPLKLLLLEKKLKILLLEKKTLKKYEK